MIKHIHETEQMILEKLTYTHTNRTSTTSSTTSIGKNIYLIMRNDFKYSIICSFFFYSVIHFDNFSHRSLPGLNSISYFFFLVFLD